MLRHDVLDGVSSVLVIGVHVAVNILVLAGAEVLQALENIHAIAVHGVHLALGEALREFHVAGEPAPFLF